MVVGKKQMLQKKNFYIWYDKCYSMYTFFFFHTLTKTNILVENPSPANDTAVVV